MNKLFLRKNTKSQQFLVFSFALLVLCSLPLSAQTAGYDLLQTGSGASVDLSEVGLGNVALQGVPIQSSTGTTDTIMHRTKDTVGGGTTPVEVTALFMKSTSSVNFQGQPVDVYITINNSGGTIATSVLPQPDALTGSTGTVTVRSDGTFDSSIAVNADVIFVKAGTSVTNSANYVATKAAPSIKLTSSGSSWSSAPPAGYPSSGSFPPGGFYPKPVHTGPHPVVPSTCGPSQKLPADPQPIADANAKTVAGQPAAGLIAVRACVSAVQ